MGNFDHLGEAEFLELKKIFYSQSYEIVENLQDGLLQLEADPGNSAVVKAVKRYFHTLKGDSNTFGLAPIGALCHKVEDLLTQVVDGARSLDHDFIELMLASVDDIYNMLLKSETDPDGIEAGPVFGRIESYMHGDKQSIGSVGGERSDTDALTEYQLVHVRSAIDKGLTLFDVELAFHPMCSEKGLGALMINKQLGEIGEVIVMRPEPDSPDMESAGSVLVLLASSLDMAEIERESHIVGVTDKVTVVERKTILAKSSDKSINETGIKGQVLRVDVSKVDKIMDLVGELIIGRSMIEQLVRDVSDGIPMSEVETRLFASNSYLERTISDLQKSVMKMRMVQINNVFRKFPKIVRDLSFDKGKHVRLEILGRETELDKGVVDSLGEPLSHIVRNMIDHGIEMPADRKKQGKPEEGLITLKAYHEAAQIVIEARDDGRGIDTAKLKTRAVEMGLYSQKEVDQFSDGDALNLIFLSGLSTSDTVSETSGRGVGMDAVKNSIESLKGTVEVYSTTGKGSTFVMRLPLTLAVMRSLLFKVAQKTYAIPLSAVSEVTKIESDSLTTVDGRQTLLLRDKIVSMLNLRKIFGSDGADAGDSSGDSDRFALILGIGGGRVGILLDNIQGQQEVVIKGVDERYSRSGLISGASILGDGKVILILDPPAIFKKAVEDERKAVEAE